MANRRDKDLVLKLLGEGQANRKQLAEKMQRHVNTVASCLKSLMIADMVKEVPETWPREYELTGRTEPLEVIKRVEPVPLVTLETPVDPEVIKIYELITGDKEPKNPLLAVVHGMCKGDKAKAIKLIQHTAQAVKMME